MGLKRYIAIPVAKVAEAFLDFFDTSPEIMSDETARKLRDKDQAEKLIREINRKRTADLTIDQKSITG